MTKHQKILNIISSIRDSHSEMVNIFTLGSCMNFFVILRSIFPKAEAYYNQDHVITKIHGKFYDINGQVLCTTHQQFTKIYNKRRTSRAFTQMINAEHKISNQ